MDDSISEDDEYFDAMLASPSAGSILIASATVNIYDDDGRRLYSLS